MPRQNQEVPYVRRDRGERTLYYRQIPGRLRPHFDNRRTWNRALPGNPGAAAWHRAYAAAHSEFEDLLQAAKAASAEHDPPKGQVTASADRQFRMRQRDIAAVAADHLRKMLRRIRGEDVEAEFSGLEPLAGKLFGLIGPDWEGMGPDQCLKQLMKRLEQLEQNDREQVIYLVVLMKHTLLETTLASMQITPDLDDLRRISKQMGRYLGDLAGDLDRLAQGDYRTGDLEAKSPELPQRVTTWEDCLSAWRRKQGSTREIDGSGVSEKREQKHRRYIRQIQDWTEEQTGRRLEAGEMTPSLMRSYRIALEDRRDVAVSTRKAALDCPKALLAASVRDGLLPNNPAEGQRVAIPDGHSEIKKFSPFSAAESALILEELLKAKELSYVPLALVVMTTGCRVAEGYQLRRQDLKQTEQGVWFFDWHYEPTTANRMLIKTKSRGNRHTPLHPLLVQWVLPWLLSRFEERLFPAIELNASVESRVSSHMGRILKRLGLWEQSRKLGWHSWRSSFKDDCRRAGVSEEYRSAITGHSTRDVGERYGVGLRFMPEKVLEQIKKIEYTEIEAVLNSCGAAKSSLGIS